jgi:group I intron endonuclease
VVEAQFIAYTITCVPTGKIYVGITKQKMRARWNQHAASRERTKLTQAIRKYGRDAFIMSHIASARSYEDLLETEKMLILQFDSRRSGLNLTDGGEGFLGARHSAEMRAAWSTQRKALWNDPEYRAKIRAAQIAAWRDKPDEERIKHAERARDLITRRPLPHRPKKQRVWKGKGWNMKSRTHCAAGHSYTEDNTAIDKRGARVCLTCKRAHRNVARDRRRAVAREARASIA